MRIHAYSCSSFEEKNSNFDCLVMELELFVCILLTVLCDPETGIHQTNNKFMMKLKKKKTFILITYHVLRITQYDIYLLKIYIFKKR